MRRCPRSTLTLCRYATYPKLDVCSLEAGGFGQVLSSEETELKPEEGGRPRYTHGGQECRRKNRT